MCSPISAVGHRLSTTLATTSACCSPPPARATMRTTPTRRLMPCGRKRQPNRMPQRGTLSMRKPSYSSTRTARGHTCTRTTSWSRSVARLTGTPRTRMHLSATPSCTRKTPSPVTQAGVRIRPRNRTMTESDTMTEGDTMTEREWEQRLLGAIDESSPELLALAARLIRTPSENPDGDCTAVAELIVTHLSAGGIAPDTFDPGQGRVSVLAHLGEKRPDDRHLVFAGHSDVVPIGDSARWSFPPFAGDIVDGYLRGRGASDMKAGLAGLIHVFMLLRSLKVPLAGKLSFVAVPDEETGGQGGADWLLDQGVLAGADGGVIAEPPERTHPTHRGKKRKALVWVPPGGTTRDTAACNRSTVAAQTCWRPAPFWRSNSCGRWFPTHRKNCANSSRNRRWLWRSVRGTAPASVRSSTTSPSTWEQ